VWEELTGWTPVRARPRDGDVVVEWRWLDNAPSREPFFANTVQLALERPFTLLFPRETTIVLHPGSAARLAFPAGPLVLSTTTAELPVRHLKLSAARSLCGRRLDWLEAVRP
jgi:hypothetical protein